MAHAVRLARGVDVEPCGIRGRCSTPHPCESRLYGLRQQAVELGGRETTPARLAQVVKQARQAKVKVIFVQKQFNPASGRALADAIRGEVMELDPLAADVEKNLEAVCGALIKGFRR